MLHPVGPLPARVYWRRRLLVLVVLLGVLAGGGWGALRLVDPARAGASAATTSEPAPTPALELVLPSLTAVRTPGSTPTAVGTPARTTAAEPTPTAGGACADDMVELTMRAPTQVRAGSSPTLTIVVRNVADVPCVRRLDAELQEVELFDAARKRVWGSNDCRPEKSDRTATLRPGQAVALDVVWSGLSSAKGCAGERRVPDAGLYVLRGRLDTKQTPELRMRLL